MRPSVCAFTRAHADDLKELGQTSRGASRREELNSTSHVSRRADYGRGLDGGDHRPRFPWVPCLPGF